MERNKANEGGMTLIADVWDEQKFFSQELIDMKFNDVQRIKFLFTRCAYRLTFLELVTKGLTQMEMHDAQAYAKFVGLKRKLEDMDVEELRGMMR